MRDTAPVDGMIWRISRHVTTALALISLFESAATAQAVREIPNAMANHTRFIIVIAVAFLAWAVSFSITTMKGRQSGRRERQLLLERRESLLDKIAELEADKEAGNVPDNRYKARMKTLRNDLASVLERLRQSRSADAKQ